ncbi:MAG: hypothetical protein CME65_06060 [Halobacteriovoraceae bacterium]|nr:hypothetical protein [Halobacteriovoraceae bacterium]
MRFINIFLTLFIFLSYWIHEAHALPRGEPVPQELESSIIKIRLKWKEKPDMPCSATVIGNKSVLTAAHCVEKIDLRSQINLLHNDYQFSVDSIFVPLKYYPAIQEYYLAQDFNEKLRAHRKTALYDIAIINLSESLPLNYKPIELSFEPPHAGKQIKIVAAGLTRVIFKYFITPVETARFRLGELEILPNKIFMVRGEDFSDPVTAPGDSGGALLESEKLIGVIRGSSATQTEAASIFTPLWLHKEFIQKYKY